MRVFSHRMNIFPKEKKFTEQEYIPKWGYIPQTEKFSLNGKNFLPKGDIFLSGENEGNIFSFGEKEGNIFPFGITTENIFPPFTPDPPLLGENYLRRFLCLQTKVSIYEVPPKYSPGNLGKIFPPKFLRENILLESFEGKYFPRNVCRGRFSLFSK